MGLDLTPRYTAGTMVFGRTSAGKGKLSFVQGDASLKLSLMPFFKGDKGEPGDAAASYSHEQTTPAIEWTIPHGLGFRPAVAITDSAGTVVYGSVAHLSLNTTVVSFGAAFSGNARLN